MNGKPYHGQIAECGMCKEPIAWNGAYWDHGGLIVNPKHPAAPAGWIETEQVTVKREYYRNHRTIGYKVGETVIDGKHYTLLQTDARDPIASPTQELLPVSQRERQFEARMALVDAIKRARLLGINDEGIAGLLQEELAQKPE